MDIIKLPFLCLWYQIKLAIHKLKTKRYLITYSMFFENDYKQIIISTPIDIVGKITWNTIEDLQKYFLERSEKYQYCSILGIMKISRKESTIEKVTT